MTPDQIHLLRKSFAQIEPQAPLDALSFYRRLFEIAPEYRPLFKRSIEEQATKFMDMLKFAVNLTDNPGGLETELRELGARHLTYGVKDQDYEVVGRAWIDTLAAVLGPEFTPATRAAWEAFYAFMADAMKRGAAAAVASGAGCRQLSAVEDDEGTSRSC